MKETLFFRQAELALRFLQFVTTEADLALKGGTAINFYVRNLPRLSVDIDLAYVPVADRVDSLQNITSILNRMSERAIKNYPKLSIRSQPLNDGTISTLFVQRETVQIKVEVNLIIRGTMHPCREM